MEGEGEGDKEEGDWGRAEREGIWMERVAKDGAAPQPALPSPTARPTPCATPAATTPSPDSVPTTGPPREKESKGRRPKNAGGNDLTGKSRGANA